MTTTEQAEWERLFRAWVWHVWCLEGTEVDEALEQANQLESPEEEARRWGEDFGLLRCDTDWQVHDGKEEPR